MGLKKDGQEIIKDGVLQKEFDLSKYSKEKLYYIPVESSSFIMYITSPVPFEDTPALKTTETRMAAS